jgi:hypothetical protein
VPPQPVSLRQEVYATFADAESTSRRAQRSNTSGRGERARLRWRRSSFLWRRSSFIPFTRLWLFAILSLSDGMLDVV